MPTSVLLENDIHQHSLAKLRHEVHLLTRVRPPRLPPRHPGDRYLIERELGRGGMATVYLARDLKHRRPVALKVLNPALAVSLGEVFFSEGQRARGQPHVARTQEVSGVYKS